MESRILIVEDSPSLRRMYSIILQEAGYDISTASSVSEALAMIRESPPFHTIVIDNAMEEKDAGTKLIAHIRLALPALPIIGMSGDDPAGEPMTKAGADYFLKKPFGPEDLRVAIRSLLR